MRAGYAVSRVGRESQVPGLFKNGKDEFRLIPIEVKYRYDLARFLRREAAEFFEAAKRWPDLCLVLVTDRPAEGRSCFQVLQGVDEAATTTDLERVAVLDIYPSTVLEYAHLATKLFSLLAGPRGAQSKARVG